MYGYALANGAVGVYNGLDRVWRAKVRCGCSAMCIRTYIYIVQYMDKAGVPVHTCCFCVCVCGGGGGCNCSKHTTYR